MSALPCPAGDEWFAAAEHEFDKITTFLCSQEASSLTHSDLERTLEAKGRELMRKLLQAHLDLRSPGVIPFRAAVPSHSALWSRPASPRVSPEAGSDLVLSTYTAPRADML